jgi:hypothetical protein
MSCIGKKSTTGMTSRNGILSTVRPCKSWRLLPFFRGIRFVLQHGTTLIVHEDNRALTEFYFPFHEVTSSKYSLHPGLRKWQTWYSLCRMKNRILLMSALLLWMGLHYTYAGQLQSSVIIIIRHAEKPDAGDGLAPAGDARANAYVDYFKHFTVNSNTIHFDYLFAAKDSHESKAS